MKHLSNIRNPELPNARMFFVTSYPNFPELAEQEWQDHLEWVRENIIGPPKATAHYTVEELIAQNMVGIYKST